MKKRAPGPTFSCRRSHSALTDFRGPTSGNGASNMDPPAAVWESNLNLERIAMTLVTGMAVLSSCEVARAQRTEQASVDSAGSEGNDMSDTPSISEDGRFVAFRSFAFNLVSGDTNGSEDVFVHDRLTGTTERVSVDSAGTQGDYGGDMPAISADGRFVAFASYSDNLVSGDTNNANDIFVHDRQTGTTERVTVDSAGVEANGGSFRPSISADGRFVAIESVATNLVSHDTNGYSDVFVHDRQTGITEIMSVNSVGGEGNYESGSPSISADGQFVAFSSFAWDLVPNDWNGLTDIFVHDRQTGATERVNVDSVGTEANSWSYESQISADGRFVSFDSFASNLVSGDTNGTEDVFVHDRQAGTTELVSVDSAGAQGNDQSALPSISADGQIVAFISSASNLVSHDTNGILDYFVHDRQSGTTERVSVDSAGTQENGWDFVPPSISEDGRFVAFDTDASNLAPGDFNMVDDVFVHGPWLTLEADPPSPPAGATLTVTTWTGMASGTALLVVTDVNGSPTFLPAVVGSFDSAGLWTLTGTVPPGFGGTVVTFETLGFVPTGKVEVSNPFAVAFQ